MPLYCSTIAFALAIAAPLPSRSTCLACGNHPNPYLSPAEQARRRPRVFVTACADGAPSSGDDTATPKANAPPETDAVSATARMAALLGRNVDADAVRQREEAAALAAETVRNKARSIKLAVASALVGLLFAVVEARNPDAPVMLMRKMEIASAPITAIGNGKPTLVDVGAPWCTTCKVAAPSLYRVTTSARFKDRVNFVIVDADDPASVNVIERFKVDGIPHQVVLDGKGKIMATLVGQVPIDVVEDDLEALLSGKDAVPYKGAAYNNVNDFDVNDSSDY
jgi:thiol-disulfide isomerase/thioredoxin